MARTPRHALRLSLLKAFARLTPAPADRPLPPAPRVLVIRPDHLGDLLFATPALRALRRRYPRAHVTALVGPWGAPVLRNNPHLDRILTLPFPGFSRAPKPSPWHPYGVLRRWARALKEEAYDLAFILRFDHWWGALLAYLARIPHRVGYELPELAPFLNHARPYVAGRHQVAQNLALVNGEREDWAARDWRSRPLEFVIPESATGWAMATFSRAPRIAMHPGAGAAVKLWRAEGWVRVADRLAREMGDEVPIVLTGSRGEKSLCSDIAARMRAPAKVLAGETTLDQLAALFARCRLVLGLDSGPLHLAAAVGTPTVQLYGPVDRATFGPWGAPERHIALASAWPCIPCNRLDYAPHELAHHPCVREIGVSEVLDAAHRVMAG